MKYRSVIISFFIFCSCNRYTIRYATDADIITTETAEPASEKACKLAENYIPDLQHINATPVRYLRVNFHIMQKSDGSGTFSEQQGIQYCHELLDNCNYRWGNNQKMNLPAGTNTEVIPTQVRLELAKDWQTGKEAIYFHRDDSLCYFIKNLRKGPYGLTDKGVFEKYSIGNDSIINIFLLEHFPDSLASPTYGTQSNGISYGNNIKIAGSYYNRYTDFPLDGGGTFNKGADQYGKLVNHEIGHSLSLYHTWNWDDSCEDTPKNDGCWSQTGNPPCDGLTTNNMMDYNWSQMAITPCQLGRIHYNLSYEEKEPKAWTVPYWCEYHPFDKVTIFRGENITWYDMKDLWGDIEIKENATLTITCSVSLPEQAKIIIKPGGKLILNGGTITNRCGDEWNGIEIWYDKKKDIDGKVSVMNKGVIEKKQN